MWILRYVTSLKTTVSPLVTSGIGVSSSLTYGSINRNQPAFRVRLPEITNLSPFRLKIIRLFSLTAGEAKADRNLLTMRSKSLERRLSKPVPD